jgi:hypothetical protein
MLRCAALRCRSAVHGYGTPVDRGAARRGTMWPMNGMGREDERRGGARGWGERCVCVCGWGLDGGGLACALPPVTC